MTFHITQTHKPDYSMHGIINLKQLKNYCHRVYHVKITLHVIYALTPKLSLCYNPYIMIDDTNILNQNKVPHIQIIGVTGIPEIKNGDHLASIIMSAADKQGTPIEPWDIIVITQKIVSKAEGRIRDLQKVKPSPKAHEIALTTGRDSHLVELILKESRSIVRLDASRGIIIVETKHGFVCANAGIDTSNIPGDKMVSLLPENPDGSASNIRDTIRQTLNGAPLSIIISDTFGRAWREGQTNFAIGVAGMNPLRDYKGTIDSCGKIIKSTNIAVADELASSAELMSAKSNNIPVVIIRGYAFSEELGSTDALLRHRTEDLFR